MASPPPRHSPLLQGYRQALNRNVNILLAGGALVQAPIGFMFLSLPVYMLRLGFDTYSVGWIFPVLGFVAVGLAVPLGIIADRFGRRPLLVLGGVVAAAAFVLLAFVATFEGFLIFAALLGAAEALYLSTWSALLADVSTVETRTSVFSLSFFVASFAMAAGSLVGIFADQAVQLGTNPEQAYRPLFVALGLALLAAAAVVVFVRPPAQEATEREPGLLPRRSMSIILRFLVANLIIGLGAGLIIPLFSAWFERQFNVGETFTGPLFAVSHVFNAFAFLAAPRLAERFGMVRAIVVAQAVATVVLLAMPFVAVTQPAAIALAIVAVLFVVRNALMNMTWPVATSFLMTTVHPNERSSAGAITTIAFRLPNSASTPVGGYLLLVDLSLPFYFTSLLYGLGTVAFWYFFRKYDAKESGEAGARRVVQAK